MVPACGVLRRAAPPPPPPPNNPRTHAHTRTRRTAGTLLIRALKDANNNLRIVCWTVGLSGESDVLVKAHTKAEEELLPKDFLHGPAKLTCIDGGPSLVHAGVNVVRHESNC